MPIAHVTTAPPATTPPAFVPDAIAIDVRVQPNPIVDVTASLNLQFGEIAPGSATPGSTFDMAVAVQGQPQQPKHIVVAAEPKERAAAASVRDALAGTAYLADAKQLSPDPVAAGMSRVSWVAPDGTRQMVEFSIDPTKVAPSYKPFGDAVSTYFDVSGLSAQLGSPPVPATAR